MQEIITATRGILNLSSLSANQYTVDFYLFLFYSKYWYVELSKRVLSLLLQYTYKELHSLMLSIDLRIFSYFSIFIIKFSFAFVYYKYQICSFVVFSNTTWSQQSKKYKNFDSNQQQQVRTTNSHYPNPDNTEWQSIIWGQVIVVR